MVITMNIYLISEYINRMKKEVIVLKDGRLIKHEEQGGYEE